MRGFRERVKTSRPLDFPAKNVRSPSHKNQTTGFHRRYKSDLYTYSLFKGMIHSGCCFISQLFSQIFYFLSRWISTSCTCFPQTPDWSRIGLGVALVHSHRHLSHICIGAISETRLDVKLGCCAACDNSFPLLCRTCSTQWILWKANWIRCRPWAQTWRLWNNRSRSWRYWFTVGVWEIFSYPWHSAFCSSQIKV